jgi:phosphoribosylcarboxyaminoimidazole (NCAIR) mutase
LFAVAMLARENSVLAKKLDAFRKKQSAAVRAMKLPVKK